MEDTHVPVENETPNEENVEVNAVNAPQEGVEESEDTEDTEDASEDAEQPVEMSLVFVKINVASLQQIISKLEEKLNPILSKDGLKENEPEIKEPSESIVVSVTVGEVQNIKNEIFVARKRIEEIIARLII